MTKSLKDYIGALLVGLALFSAWTWGLPTYNRISDLKATIKEKEDILSSRNSLIGKIKELNNQYQQRASEIGKLSSVVPKDKSVAEIVSAVENISSRNGLQLINISVSEQGSKPGDQFSTLAVNIVLNGSYPSMVSFLQDMEKNIRLSDVTAIEASKGNNPNDPSSLNLRLNISMYYIK